MTSKRCVAEMELWEKSPKHLFVLSSAGKPIFTKNGDEHELVTTFGLLQAVASIIQDSGDEVHTINAGVRRIVYLMKRSLIFVAISSTGEPEPVLRQQLEFIHNQILFVLTSKIHDVLSLNPSKDVRELLGQDTNRLVQASCKNMITSPCIVYNCVLGFSLEQNLRRGLYDSLREALLRSNAAFGCIFLEDSLITFATNERMEVKVDVTDILLLSHFVCHSSSLRTHDQNWVPLCLPSLNAGGYVQAYIAALRFDDISAALSLVLISASSASENEFKLLHQARLDIQNNNSNGFSRYLMDALNLRETAKGQNYLSAVQCLHFFFKYSPPNGVPAQCLWAGESSQTDSMSSIWTHCYRLGACLRDGSSTPETTIMMDSLSLPPGSNIFIHEPAADHALAYATLESGVVIVGLATSDSELYVSFPMTVDSNTNSPNYHISQMSALDACGLANFLTRMLRKEVDTLFQC